MTAFAVGTSGYSYKQWLGVFYPEKLASKEMLSFYAERLGSVEINSTFYRFATVKVLESWASQVGDGFTFTLKAPRRVTHTMRLREATELAGDFCRNAATLGDKLGAVLFQLPPNFKKDLDRLNGFLDGLAAEVPIVFEFRHDSWFDDEVLDSLRRFSVALCVNDGGGLTTPTDPTAPFAYYRLRREAYDDAELGKAAERIRAATDGLQRVMVYFKHEDQGPAYAGKLAALLNG